MFTRHQAALREEQMDRMAGIERRENESQKCVTQESTDRKIDLIEDTSDEEIVNECDDDFVSGSETEPIETTHRVLSPKIPVQIPQTSNTKSGLKPLTPKSVNRKHRSHTKKSQSTKVQSQVQPLTEGDLLDIKEGEPVNQNNTYMLDSLSQMINGAISRMTDAIGKVFRTTIQEVNQEKDVKKVSESRVQRSRATIKQNRRKLHEPSPVSGDTLDSESDTDDKESARTNGSSTSIRSIFPSRSRSNSVKLPAFKGESDDKWKAYINRFEAVAKYYDWTDEDKLGQLLPRLQGPAGEFAFEELRPEILSNYKRLVRELGSRFGIIETNRTYQTKFRRRDQKNGEHIQDYAAELKRLYSKAYPNRTNATKQEDLISRFLLGLTNEKARVHVELNRDPQTVEEATEFVIEFEEATKYPKLEDENQNGNRRRPTRQVKSCTTDASRSGSKDANKGWSQKNRKGQQETQQKKPGNLKDKNSKDQSHDYITRSELKDVINEVLISVQSQTSPPADSHRKPLICYKCGEQGHYANSCKSEKTQKGFKQEKRLNPQANEFQPQLN